MSFVTIPDTWIEVGKALVQRLFQRIKDDLDFLFSSVGVLQGNTILNGFFEIVEDEAAVKKVPTSWGLIEYLGGTVELDDTASTKGLYALKFNHPGGGANGGGQATSDYYAVDEDTPVILGQTFWSDSPTIDIKIQVEYFDEDQVFIIASTETLYSQASNNPTAPERITLFPTIPAGARYLKYIFIGGDVGTDPGGSTDTYLDDVFVNLLDEGSVTQPKLSYQPGSELIHANAAQQNSVSLAYVKLKESQVVRTGIITVYWEFKTDIGAVIVYTKVYINGVAIGTEQSTSDGITWATRSQDHRVKAGDLVQIYGKSSNGGTNVQARSLNLNALYQQHEGAIL